jgi:hypothetical protein
MISRLRDYIQIYDAFVESFNSSREQCSSFAQIVWRGRRAVKKICATMKRAEQLSPTIERLERALLLLAYFIELDGDIHLPMYEKFETELAELREKEALKDRARERLKCYLSDGGGLKAIR